MEFLRQVADIYLERERETLMNACFVFPNRRSSLFFRKYLGQQAGGVLFSPPVTTINALFYELTDRQPIDRIAGLLRLYAIYRELTGDATETLDHFILWGDMLMNDFSDLDKYLVDAKQLFTNVRDLRDLDAGYEHLSAEQKAAIRQFWGSFREQAPSSNERSFRKIWEVLYEIYERFNADLAADKLGYEGALYREVVEALRQPAHPIHQQLQRHRRYVFVGLNALTACERELLQYLKKNDLADFYWDYHGDLIRDEQNRASWFMQDNLADFQSRYPLPEEPFKLPEITVVGIPSLVGQAKYAGRLLEEDLAGADLFKTALVLPQEQALDPLLDSLPTCVDSVNVTMGYPLHNSKVQSFFRYLSQLVDRCRYDNEQPMFYHAALMNVLNHPCLTSRFTNEITRIRKHVVKNNLIYVPAEVLCAGGVEEFGQLFGKVPKPTGDKVESTRRVADYFLETLSVLGRSMSALDQEFLYHLYAAIVRLRDLNLPLELKTWLRVLDQLTAGTSIPYRGEPLAGLQIMGPLETRALDFDNLILFSVNEGTFPSQSVSNSFIPYNLRKGFGMPTYEYQDAIQAYYFYRMISRAKRVWLLYDQRTDGLKSGEESRFIKQLRYQYRVPMRELVMETSVHLAPQEEILVHKTPEFLERLRSLPFSASALNVYLKCPMQFFFSKTVDEEEEVQEDIEANTFGTLFHRVIQLVYEPMVGTAYDVDRATALLENPDLLDDYIQQAFREELKLSVITGKNKIIQALLKTICCKVLELDLSEPVELKGLELRREIHFPLSDGSTVLLKGFIDRMDKVNHQIRILDYKTGGSKLEFKEVEEMFDATSDKRPYTAFQLCFYDLLTRSTRSVKGEPPLLRPDENAQLAVYSVKDLFQEEGTPGFLLEPKQSEQYQVGLCRLIEEILDPSKPFVRSSMVDHHHSPCKTCSYTKYCNSHYVKNL
ncbi:MAG: PD-(D/E)XK nuclease family protein [Bacteroidales bacterium]|nr:PD-(D/E)XK nuclease family protein [Bacteroidales bacterium]